MAIQRDNFQTPNSSVVPTVNVVVVIPDDDRVFSILQACILLATDAENWNKNGSATPEFMAEVFTDIWYSIEKEP